MACVYWIHLQDHTDLFSQGYIGYSSREPSDRFCEHKEMSRYRTKKNSRKKTILDRAIAKHGEALIVSTICICSEEYGLWLENKLRPDRLIGWNLAAGGGKPPGVKGLPVSQETRDKIGLAHKGKIISPETIEKMRKANLGKKLSEETRLKISLAGLGRTWKATDQQRRNMSKAQKKFFSDKEWWELLKSEDQSLNVQIGDIFETVITKFPNETVRTYCKALGIPYHFSRERFIKSVREGNSILSSFKWKETYQQNDYSVVDESVFIKKNRPWTNPKADKNVWVDAASYVESFDRCSFKSLSHFMFSRYDKLDVMHNLYITGWIPSKDSDYLAWRDNYLKKLKENNDT